MLPVNVPLDYFSDYKNACYSVDCLESFAQQYLYCRYCKRTVYFCCLPLPHICERLIGKFIPQCRRLMWFWAAWGTEPCLPCDRVLIERGPDLEYRRRLKTREPSSDVGTDTGPRNA